MKYKIGSIVFDNVNRKYYLILGSSTISGVVDLCELENTCLDCEYNEVIDDEKEYTLVVSG
jgi:hypothetical protein